jgi:hypothetical protein
MRTSCEDTYPEDWTATQYNQQGISPPSKKLGVREGCESSPALMVEYQTGATRSADNPYDPEGFLDPKALQIFCEYMEKHCLQKDGKLRDSDNWQKGMEEKRVYRSLIRHTFDAWLIRRGYPPKSVDCTGLNEALCAIIFNAMVLLKQGAQ